MIRFALFSGAILAIGCGAQDPNPNRSSQGNDVSNSVADGSTCEQIKGYPIDPIHRCYWEEKAISGACPQSIYDNRSAALGPACLVSPSGEVYVTLLGTSIAIKGQGWTYSGSSSLSSLSSEDRKLCDDAFEIVGWSDGFSPTPRGEVCL
jgi:hypothetical protein